MPPPSPPPPAIPLQVATEELRGLCLSDALNRLRSGNYAGLVVRVYLDAGEYVARSNASGCNDFPEYTFDSTLPSSEIWLIGESYGTTLFSERGHRKQPTFTVSEGSPFIRFDQLGFLRNHGDEPVLHVRRGGRAAITACLFANSSASAVVVTGGSLSVTRSMFVDNVGLTPLVVSQSGDVAITDSSFHGNHATMGGAISLQATQLCLQSGLCTRDMFCPAECRPREMRDVQLLQLRINKCNFTGNRATLQGGSLHPSRLGTTST